MNRYVKKRSLVPEKQQRTSPHWAKLRLATSAVSQLKKDGAGRAIAKLAEGLHMAALHVAAALGETKILEEMLKVRLLLVGVGAGGCADRSGSSRRFQRCAERHIVSLQTEIPCRGHIWLKIFAGAPPLHPRENGEN